MKLAEYLADFVQVELDRRYEDSGANGQWSQGDLEEWLQQGLAAFVATENATVEVIKPDGMGSTTTEHYS